MLSNLLVGNCAAGGSGTATLSGGSLYVTNAAHLAMLNVQNGTLTLSSGLLQVDTLVLTNAAGHFVHSGGSLSYRRG